MGETLAAPPQPKTDADALVCLHHARTQALSIPLSARAYSHRWLLDHGYPSGLPDELKPQAELLYPVVVDAVGVAVLSGSSLTKPIVPMVRQAMSDAVLECYADGTARLKSSSRECSKRAATPFAHCLASRDSFMKYLLAVALIVWAGMANAAATVLWSMPIGETDVDADEVDGIGMDASGNTIVSGVFRTGIVLGGRTFTSRGQGDIFVASYDPAGAFRWARQIGSTGEDNTFDLQAMPSGETLASGWFAGTVDFGGVTLTSAGGQDMFVAKFDSAGRTIWAKRFGGPAADGGNEIFVLPNGGIAVSAMSGGKFEGHAYGGGDGDAYVLRLDVNGNTVWRAPFNGPGLERIRGISMNGAGEIAVGFEYQGALAGMQSRGDFDGAVAKLAATGAMLWIKPLGGAGYDNARGTAISADGSVYVSCTFAGSAFLIDRAMPAVSGNGDDCLIKINSAGVPEWFVTLSGPGSSPIGPEIRLDDGGILASGRLDGGTVTVKLGSAVTATLTSPRITSYLAGFTSAGAFRFAYMPTPVGTGAGAIGDVLATNGRRASQALRFSKRLDPKPGVSMFTPSARDSAIVRFALD